MLSNPSLPSLPGLLWPGVVLSDWFLFIGQMELNCVLMLKWIVWNGTFWEIEPVYLCKTELFLKRTVYMHKNGFGFNNLQWLIAIKSNQSICPLSLSLSLSVYIYIYIVIVSWLTVVEDDPKVLFSIATSPIWWIAQLLSLDCFTYPWSIPYNAVLSKEASCTIFESLLWLDLGLNPGLSDHWWTIINVVLLYL